MYFLRSIPYDTGIITLHRVRSRFILSRFDDSYYIFRILRTLSLVFSRILIVFSPFLSFIAQSTSFDVDTSLPYYTSFGLDYRVPSLHRGYVYAVARQRGSTELVRAVGADRVRPRSGLLDNVDFLLLLLSVLIRLNALW